MVTGIGHVAYATGNMEAVLGFYCGRLGLSHVFSIRDAEGNPWIEYVKAGPGQFLEFFYAEEGELAAGGSYKHLCLTVDDIFAQAAALEAAGVSLTAAPLQGKDGNWQCWAADPDGRDIEFMQISPSSPQARA